MKKITFNLILIILIININAQTNPIQWQKSFGGNGDDEAYSIIQTIDNGYIIAGSTSSNNGNVAGNHGGKDYWIVKLDSLGNIQWQKCYGGINDDVAYSIQQTTDSGYVIAGYTNSNNGNVTGNHDTTGITSDYWIIKIDTIGNILWQKCFGGNNSDVAYSIQQTIDSGYIIAGSTSSNEGDVIGHHANIYYDGYDDYWIIKIDSIGNIQWQKCLGGDDADIPNSIKKTIDGGYIIVGCSYSNNGDVTGNHSNGWDYWVVKIDSIGNIQWQKSLGGSDNDFGSTIQQTLDGGYIVGGSSYSNNGDITMNHGGGDGWVVKLDTIGNIQWQKSLGGTNKDYENSIQQINNGYIIVGSTSSNNGDIIDNHGNFDYWIVKLDYSGNIIWQKCLGGTGFDNACSILQTIDDAFIIAGASMSNDGDVIVNHGNNDFWIVKLNPNTSIENIELPKENFSIYPIPANSFINIETEIKEKGDIVICIYNSLGVKVYENIEKNKTDNFSKQLNISGLSSGLYIVNISTASKHFSKRIVKM